MLYRRITQGLNDKGKLIPHDADVYSHISTDQDYYLSTYKYSEDHKKTFQSTGTITGITDVLTDKIWFDFDSEIEPEYSRKDAIHMVNRLKGLGIDDKDIIKTFSGNKGFGIELYLNHELNPKEVKNIAFELAKGLSTFDVKMYNASRIFRIIATKHNKTGLYKIPLTTELLNSNMDTIMGAAKTYPENDPVAFRWDKVTLPESLLKSKDKAPEGVKLEDKKFDIKDIDFSHKIKGWTNCKWAVLNGYQVKQNDRHEKLLAIIAQSKALNNTKQQAYYNAKMADEYGTSIYGGSKSTKEDLWLKVESVYSDNWKGGTFTCKDGKTTWLTDICNSLGINKCKHTENETLINVQNVSSKFNQYAKDIEKNTIKTGIKDLDDSLRLTTGQMVGALGAPSAGKTAWALKVLRTNSDAGLLSVFYSLDMADSELYQKMAQNVTGYSAEKVFDIFKNDPIEAKKIEKAVEESFKNVKFCFDTGTSVGKIEEALDDLESTHGGKAKLLLLDYNELLSSPHSDATAASGYNAGALKKLTNTRGICTISLLQPPKMVGDASDEINSYRNIKGSSLLEQCFSTIIGMYRPGFSAENDSQDDNFMIMNILKNRMGKLFTLLFYWNGQKGDITSIDDFGRKQLKDLRAAKKMDKALSSSGLNF